MTIFQISTRVLDAIRITFTTNKQRKKNETGRITWIEYNRFTGQANEIQHERSNGYSVHSVI